VPLVTCAAMANCLLYQGATPVFAGVDPGALLIDPDHVEAKLTERTKAVIAVDYAGQPRESSAARDHRAARPGPGGRLRPSPGCGTERNPGWNSGGPDRFQLPPGQARGYGRVRHDCYR